MQLLKINILCIVAILLSATVSSQKLSVTADIDSPLTPGFYKIRITPLLSSYARLNFTNLRLVNEKEELVPFLLRSRQTLAVTKDYHQLLVKENELSDSGKSVIIIENAKQDKISSLALLIRNAAVSRMATISGSDDMKKWFTIFENAYLQNQLPADSDKYIQPLSFPASSYKYLRIIIDNARNNPLNIIEARVYDDLPQTRLRTATVNPPMLFTQLDSSDHNTYIRIHQAAAYHVDKITLQVSAPKFFERYIDVINSNGVANFKISSGKLPELYLPVFNDSMWLIRIYNEDNQPLRIKSVETEQEAREIIAYLETPHKYHLLMSDSFVSSPRYDLQKFTDSIPKDILQLNIVSYKKSYEEIKLPQPSLFSKWLWPLIIIMIAVLSFLTYSLTKKIEHKK